MIVDAYLADLRHGGVLAIDPQRGEVEIFADAERAVAWLTRGGWDYHVTEQNTDTADEIDRWIPLGDPRSAQSEGGW